MSSASSNTIRAVLWDFGGVILSSPFDAFARYEVSAGLPNGLIRSINATNPHDNAWAKFERSDVNLDEFADLFEAEAAALGPPRRRPQGHVVAPRRNTSTDGRGSSAV